MRMKIIIFALGIGLLASLSWGAIGMYNNQVYQENIAALRTAVIQRDATIQQAFQDYTQVQDYYAQSQIEVRNLQGEVVNLEANITQLEVEITDLEQETIYLDFKYDTLESKYEREIAHYKREREEAKFTFYYAGLASQRYGLDDLEDYIYRWEWKETAYEVSKFDCSQMSAYLEWKLENEGYHTVIVAGDSPDGNGKHAWLLVETSVEEYMPVEATTYSIVYWSSPYFDNYFEYEYEFETIQEALSYSQTEFNWWD